MEQWNILTGAIIRYTSPPLSGRNDRNKEASGLRRFPGDYGCRCCGERQEEGTKELAGNFLKSS